MAAILPAASQVDRGAGCTRDCDEIGSLSSIVTSVFVERRIGAEKHAGSNAADGGRLKTIKAPGNTSSSRANPHLEEAYRAAELLFPAIGKDSPLFQTVEKAR